jgi:hypothetical protein
LGLTIIYLLTGNDPTKWLPYQGYEQIEFPPEVEVSKNLQSWLDKMIKPIQPDDENKGFVLARSAQAELRSFNFRTSNLIEIGKRMFDNILGGFPR